MIARLFSAVASWDGGLKKFQELLQLEECVSVVFNDKATPHVKPLDLPHPTEGYEYSLADAAAESGCVATLMFLAQQGVSLGSTINLRVKDQVPKDTSEKGVTFHERCEPFIKKKSLLKRAISSNSSDMINYVSIKLISALDDGTTRLHGAAAADRFFQVTSILNSCPDALYEFNHRDESAFYWAAFSGSTRVMTQLFYHYNKNPPTDPLVINKISNNIRQGCSDFLLRHVNKIHHSQFNKVKNVYSISAALLCALPEKNLDDLIHITELKGDSAHLMSSRTDKHKAKLEYNNAINYYLTHLASNQTIPSPAKENIANRIAFYHLKLAELHHGSDEFDSEIQICEQGLALNERATAPALLTQLHKARKSQLLAAIANPHGFLTAKALIENHPQIFGSGVSLLDPQLLSHVIRYGSLATVQFFLNQISVIDSESSNYFLYWSLFNSRDVTLYVINVFVKRNVPTSVTSLQIAAALAPRDKISQLIENDVSKLISGNSPSHSAAFYAAFAGNEPVVTYMISVCPPLLLPSLVANLVEGFTDRLVMLRNNPHYNQNLAILQAAFDVSLRMASQVSFVNYDYLRAVAKVYALLSQLSDDNKTIVAIEFLASAIKNLQQIENYTANDDRSLFQYFALLAKLYESRENYDVAITCYEFAIRHNDNMTQNDVIEEDEKMFKTLNLGLKKVSALSIIMKKIQFLGCKRVDVPKDGDCFFHAVALCLRSLPNTIYPTISAREIQDMTVAHIENELNYYCEFSGTDAESLLILNAEYGAFSGELLVRACARALNLNMFIVSSMTKQPIIIRQLYAEREIYLCNLDEWHYQSLIPLASETPIHQYIQNAPYDNYMVEKTSREAPNTVSSVSTSSSSLSAFRSSSSADSLCSTSSDDSLSSSKRKRFGQLSLASLNSNGVFTSRDNSTPAVHSPSILMDEEPPLRGSNNT